MKYLKLFNQFNENVGQERVYVGVDGGLNYPAYISSEPDDDLDIAFDKGAESYYKSVDKEENPYSLEQYPNANLVQAWNDGWMNAEYNAINNN